MKYTNAYFQLDIRLDGVYLHLYPAMDNGKPLAFQEVAQYLDGCGIKEYDIKELNNAISSNKDCEVLVSKTAISEVGEKAVVEISSDKMSAVIRFYPPSKNGSFILPNSNSTLQRFATSSVLNTASRQSGNAASISSSLLR